MATLASTRRVFMPIHQLVLRSKPSPHSRAFHASSQHRFLDTCFGIVHTGLTGMHSFTGLPWWATIPCFALVVRTFILGPLTVYLYRLNRRRDILKPVILAWAHASRKKIYQEYGAQGPEICHKKLIKELGRKSREIHRRHGAQVWKNLLSLGQLPFFLVIVETIRKMCGTHMGLLGLMTAGVTQGDLSILETIPLEQLIAQDQGKELFTVEESFGIEGALWFPDLLVPDPLMILPFALSGSMFLNILYQTRRNSGLSESKWSRRFGNSMKVLAFAIGPLTLQVPSAMLVYWISSSLWGLGQVVLMQRYFPRKPVLKPCKGREQQFLLGARSRN